MVRFKQKRIVTVKSIGEDLSQARRKFNLSLAAVEHRIGIGKQYLEALENNDWGFLPGEVYAKNFLKRYGDFLGLLWADLQKKYSREVEKYVYWGEEKKKKFGVDKKKLFSFPKLVRNFLVGAVIAVALGYIGIQVYGFVKAPELALLYPEENFEAKGGFVKILGKAEAESVVSLNDKEIATDNDGYFAVDMNLNKGLNVIKMEAEKSYGQKTVVYRRIIVE